MDNITFEKAHARLEEILEQMNREQTLDLDKSLKLFEEANQLIIFCQKQLQHTQQRVDLLIKNRDQQLACKDDGSVCTEPFSLSQEQERSL